MTRENVVLNQVLLSVGSMPGARVWRQQSGDVLVIPGSMAGRVRAIGVPVHRVRLAPEGASDIVGLLRGGRFLAIECKAGDGKLRPAQEKFGAMVTERGGLWIVARSGEEALAALAEAER